MRVSEKIKLACMSGIKTYREYVKWLNKNKG